MRIEILRDFDDDERALVQSVLDERYGVTVETQLAEVELRLDPDESELTSCPSIYWEGRGAAFVVARIPGNRWRAVFFYPGDPRGEQYVMSRPHFDDLAECLTAVLQAQSDHEKVRRGVASGDSAEDFVDGDGIE